MYDDVDVLERMYACSKESIKDQMFYEVKRRIQGTKYYLIEFCRYDMVEKESYMLWYAIARINEMKEWRFYSSLDDIETAMQEVIYSRNGNNTA